MSTDKSTETAKENREVMPSIVAVDDGYANTKVAWYDKKARAIRTHVIASRAVDGLQIADMAGESMGGYITDEMRFTVGNFSEPLDTRNDNFPFSALNRAIIHHALREAGFARTEDQVIETIGVTMPFRSFYADPKGVIARRRDSLSIPVDAAMESSFKLSFNPEGIHTFPEAVMGWIDHVIADDGSDAADATQDIVVVDIGGRTTDIAVFDSERAEPNQERSGTEEFGVMNVIALIRNDLEREHKVDLPNRVVERAMREGSLTIFGKKVDVTEIVSKAKRQIAQKIYDSVHSRVKSAASMQVVFIGGGALVMQGVLESYPHAQVPKDPHFANARGVLKYLLYR